MTHEPGIETLNLLCGDQFYRDHWRATCSCGWKGRPHGWRSGAGEDFALHFAKSTESEIPSSETPPTPPTDNAPSPSSTERAE